MTDAKPNRIIPNAYQSPNFYVDDLLPLLTGEEWKCMSFLIRKTLGWQKFSDRLAKSVISKSTGLAESTVDKSMASLIEFGLALRVNPNNITHDGIEYSVQMYDDKINWNALEGRKQKNIERNEKRTQAARKALKLKITTTQSVPHTPSVAQTPTPSVAQGTQKPIKPTIKSLGEEQPAHTRPQKKGDIMDGILYFAALAEDRQNQLSDRVQDYPQDCQQTLRWFVEVFELLPSAIPAKPTRGGKGGDFALWINELREINGVLEGFGKKAMLAVKAVSKNLSISHPGAIMWALPAEVGKLAAKEQRFAETAEPKQIDTPFTQALNQPYVVRPRPVISSSPR